MRKLIIALFISLVSFTATANNFEDMSKITDHKGLVEYARNNGMIAASGDTCIDFGFDTTAIREFRNNAFNGIQDFPEEYFEEYMSSYKEQFNSIMTSGDIQSTCFKIHKVAQYAQKLEK